MIAAVLAILICAALVSVPTGVFLLMFTKDLEFAWRETWTTFLGLLVIGLVFWAAIAALFWIWGAAA